MLEKVLFDVGLVISTHLEGFFKIRKSVYYNAWRITTIYSKLTLKNSRFFWWPQTLKLLKMVKNWSKLTDQNFFSTVQFVNGQFKNIICRITEFSNNAFNLGIKPHYGASVTGTPESDCNESGFQTRSRWWSDYKNSLQFGRRSRLD